MALGSERGASHWLAVLPLTDHGFTLHKAHSGTPSAYSMPHLHVYISTFPLHLWEEVQCTTCFQLPLCWVSMRCNDIRDITAHIFTEMCPSVSVEPALQPLTGEQLQYQTAHSDDNARAHTVSAHKASEGPYNSMHFRCTGDQPSCTKLLYILHDSCVQVERGEEETGLQAKNHRGGHGCFTPLVRIFCKRWHETSNNHGQQWHLSWQRRGTILRTLGPWAGFGVYSISP